MAYAAVWDRLDIQEKEHVILVLNGEARFEPKTLDPISGWAILQRRAKLGLPTPVLQRAVIRELMREDEQVLSPDRERVRTVSDWKKNSAGLPRDIGRCKQCSRFFLIGKRRNQVYCLKPSCTERRAVERARRAMQKRNSVIRERKLKRVRAALKDLRNLPDWKERTARKAGVTKNFVTYAINRKELTEVIEFLNIERVNEGDKVLSVEFRHNWRGCDYVLDVSSAEQVHGGLVRTICEKLCPRCQTYSGFNCVSEDYDQGQEQKKIDAEQVQKPSQERWGRLLQLERKQDQENLQELLPRFVARPSIENRGLLQKLVGTEGRRLRVRFKISPASNPA
jgi:hypothetical protein